VYRPERTTVCRRDHQCVDSIGQVQPSQNGTIVSGGGGIASAFSRTLGRHGKCVSERRLEGGGSVAVR
jgi:hypothetical protein